MASSPNLRTLNLNLLPVLREVLRHRNVTRAAEALGMTQSAVSNALRQLREHFSDDLLVRDGRTMRLTSVSLLLIDPLEEIMIALESFIAPTRFEPAHSSEKFQIATADYVMMVLAPAMSSILQHDAPGISLQFLTARRGSLDDLKVGRIDMVIMPRQMLFAGVSSRQAKHDEFVVTPLLTEAFMVVGHEDDPDMQGELTTARYVERAHAGFFLDYNAHASVEQYYFREMAIERFERLLVSSFATLPLIAARSDCLALLPQSLAALASQTLPVIVRPCPVEMPAMELVMVWHKRRNGDSGVSWLETSLRRCAENVHKE